MEYGIGRRERKKAATRKALADAALQLFSERGFDEVGVKEVAEAAGVSLTTLFKYFPSKESLVFDQAEESEAALVAAVCQRAPGQSVLDGLHMRLRSMLVAMPSSEPELSSYLELVDSTPALRAYSRRLWLDQEDALTAAISKELDRDPADVEVRALARFALEIRLLARDTPDPLAAVDTLFGLLTHGWGRLASATDDSPSNA
ncbi:TetR family transcriptional regulator [Streptomyces sp. NPDC047043]|uniref:TetR family transcriptional regulator n=1 Tax=Streptomyces sp. NPDC047043 TaxID=3154497 RepID=UPI0033CCC4CA